MRSALVILALAIIGQATSPSVVRNQAIRSMPFDPAQRSKIDHERDEQIHAVDEHAGSRHAVDYAREPYAKSIAKLFLDGVDAIQTLHAASAQEAATEPASSIHDIRKSCTATLLQGQRYLLTALHCLYRYDHALGRHVEERMHGRFRIVFGFHASEWHVAQEQAIEGFDLFANDAVVELKEFDLALIRLSERLNFGRVRIKGDSLEFVSAGLLDRAAALAAVPGIALLPAAGSASGLDLSQRRYSHQGLYAYSADIEIGERGRILTVDTACRGQLDGSAGKEVRVQARDGGCHAYPGGSGGPLLVGTREGRIYLAGVVVESEHVSRKASIVKLASFRDQLPFLSSVPARVAPSTVPESKGLEPTARRMDAL